MQAFSRNARCSCGARAAWLLCDLHSRMVVGCAALSLQAELGGAFLQHRSLEDSEMWEEILKRKGVLGARAWAPGALRAPWLGQAGSHPLRRPPFRSVD